MALIKNLVHQSLAPTEPATYTLLPSLGMVDHNAISAPLPTGHWLFNRPRTRIAVLVHDRRFALVGLWARRLTVERFAG